MVCDSTRWIATGVLLCLVVACAANGPTPNTISNLGTIDFQGLQGLDRYNPLELLDILVARAETREPVGPTCIVVKPQEEYVRKKHIPKLMARIGSERLCAAVAVESSLPLPGWSTEGRLAAFLVQGYRSGRFPGTLDSDHFNYDPHELRAWWSIQQRHDFRFPGVPSRQPITLDPSERRVAELDIMEAFFRYQFESNGSYQQQAAPSYFLSVTDGSDPPPELMARFFGHKPPVLPVSALTNMEYEKSKLPEGVSIPGLIFTVEEIEWLTDNFVSATCEYFEGGLSASGGTYYATREDGVWVVLGGRLTWIS